MDVSWRRSSRCAADKPQCVEIWYQHTVAGVRDSKHPAAELVVPPAGLVALLRHITT